MNRTQDSSNGADQEIQRNFQSLSWVEASHPCGILNSAPRELQRRLVLMFIRNEVKHWLKMLPLRSGKGRAAARLRAARLQVEPLEERATPTANVTGLSA